MLLKESKTMRVYSYSPQLLDQILADIASPAERNLAEQIITRFADAGLKIQVKHLYYDKPHAFFQVRLFIKKSAEHVIINTKTHHGKGTITDESVIQIRISNQSTLDNLDTLSENVLNQIINGGDCGNCYPTCEGKQYRFSYQGKDYIKCRVMCNNFHFTGLAETDIPAFMTMIDNELVKSKSAKK